MEKSVPLLAADNALNSFAVAPELVPKSWFDVPFANLDTAIAALVLTSAFTMFDTVELGKTRFVEVT